MTEEKLVAALFLVCVDIFSQLLFFFLDTSGQNSGHFFFFLSLSLVVLSRKKRIFNFTKRCFCASSCSFKTKETIGKPCTFAGANRVSLGTKSQDKTSLIIVMAARAAAVVVD